MYRVLVADDEPLAVKSICSIIERRCSEYKVEAVAQNGQEALEKIRKILPELVICDIKMPLITGVELAGIVRDEHPEICVILVSGYQDFEYAHSAIRSGVTDYLLKPIVPSTLLESLEYASGRIREICYQERNCVLSTLASGETVDKEKVKRCFPYNRYYGALLRTNGLPKRFSLVRSREIYSDIHEEYIVFGRDEMESLYLIPQELLPEDGFLTYLNKIRSQQKESDYYTLIYDSTPFDSSELWEKIQTMYQELDLKSSVGVTQAINLSEPERDLQVPMAKLRKEEEKILARLDSVVRTWKTDQIKAEIRKCYDIVQQYSPSQLWMENFTREIIFTMRQNSFCTLSVSESERLLGDVFYYASSVNVLVDGLMEIFFHVQGDKEDTGSKVGSQEYICQVCDYLEINISKPITLSELCRHFGISQTYMSKLFRKYTGSSFNQYFTELRMNRAKELFRENPDIFIKDVAAMVGYEDQFYFSRIFRSYTSKSPSEFIKEL